MARVNGAWLRLIENVKVMLYDKGFTVKGLEEVYHVTSHQSPLFAKMYIFYGIIYSTKQTRSSVFD